VPTQSDRGLDLYESALETPFGRLVLLGIDVDEEDASQRPFVALSPWG
jgi:hypothetical protein